MEEFEEERRRTSGTSIAGVGSYGFAEVLRWGAKEAKRRKLVRNASRERVEREEERGRAELTSLKTGRSPFERAVSK